MDGSSLTIVGVGRERAGTRFGSPAEHWCRVRGWAAELVPSRARVEYRCAVGGRAGGESIPLGCRSSRSHSGWLVLIKTSADLGSLTPIWNDNLRRNLPQSLYCTFDFIIIILRAFTKVVNSIEL
jgi:hypothetical protein